MDEEVDKDGVNGDAYYACRQGRLKAKGVVEEPSDDRTGKA